MNTFTSFFTENINFLVPLIRFLEMLALMLVSSGVIWKVFGPRIASYIESIADDQDKRHKDEIIKEIDKVINRQKEIIKRLDTHDKADMNYRGYSILRACKEGLEKRYIGELEYQQLELMYNSYINDDGNGAVRKIWKKFTEEVDIK